MAALAPLSSTPARQPFGTLHSSKVRTLQSVKNCQNALLTSSTPSSLKRRHASPDVSDSENVDPNLLNSFSKRKRSAFDDDVSVSKPPRYSLNTIAVTKPRLTDFAATPRLGASTRSATPISAPAAAGRSPTRPKPRGLAGKQRFAPPSFGTKSPSPSIAAALKGTLAHKKVKKARTIEESKPKSWFFDILEESEEQQEYTVNEWTMTQSATILDISDDEGKNKNRLDKGKENVDPNEVVAPITRSQAKAAEISRKDMMTDESRSPLGDLNPSDYFPEGLDATSVVLVQDDPPAQPQPPASIDTVVESAKQADFTFEAEAAEVHDQQDVGPVDLTALVTESNDIDTAETLVDETEVRDEPVDIEIWESESAKDENETAAEGIFAV